MIPTAAIRTAIFDALNGNVGASVVSVPSRDLGDHVLIDSIRVFEDTAQTDFIYDVLVSIEVFTQFNKTGNKSAATTIAAAIDNIIRPQVVGTISVSGWNNLGAWLDNSNEFVDTINEKKVVRHILMYRMKFNKI